LHNFFFNLSHKSWCIHQFQQPFWD